MLQERKRPRKNLLYTHSPQQFDEQQGLIESNGCTALLLLSTTARASSIAAVPGKNQQPQVEECPPPHRRSGTYERMDRARNGRELHGRADFAGTGLAAVATAMSYLLPTLCGRNDPPLDPFTTWQVILALGLMSAGLLLVMYGVRAPGARPPVLVRRAADAAGALLWYAAGPERLLPLTILLVLSYLEAWFDFF